MTKHLKETDKLKKIVESFPKVTITVVGDLVADEFVFGEISRVSREAPVLILKYRERSVSPGGGANAIHNLADLGVNVLPVGFVGTSMFRSAAFSKTKPASQLQKPASSRV
jgi:bifunctional ADP-heptose synthase (sugar kinase/adenylyltransferase)